MAENLVRRKERSGTEAASKNTVLMTGELGALTDTKKLIVGDGERAGGYLLTPDNVVTVWPDETDATAASSLAWWIAWANGNDVQLRLPAGVYNINSDFTIPANVTLVMDAGARFCVASGKTLTLNCKVNADEIINAGTGTVEDNAERPFLAHENLIHHNPSYWEPGRMDVRETIGNPPQPNPDLGKDYNNINSDMAGLRYKHKIPVTGGKTYTIKSWGRSGCRMFFYKEAEAEPHPAHPASWEDITMSDDICVGTELNNNDVVNNIAKLKAGYTFTAPAQATYMRLFSYVLGSSGSVTSTSIFTIGSDHLYKLEEGSAATFFTPAPGDSNIDDAYTSRSGERPKNDPIAAKQLVSCMESYVGHGWVYGRKHINEDSASASYSFKGPADDDLYDASAVDASGNPTDCEKSLDCMAPIFLSIAGIPYWQSRYTQLYNRWRGAHYYPWAKYPDTARGSAGIEWLYKNSFEIKPGINYSKLQAGDLVFWRTSEYKSEYNSFKNGFRMWDHVGMFTGRWVESTPDPDPGGSGWFHGDAADGRLHPEVIESGGYGAVTTQPDGSKITKDLVMYRFLDRQPNDDAPEGTSTGSSPALECMFARVPLETPYSEFDTEADHKNTLSEASRTDSDNMIYTAAYSPAVHVKGQNNASLHINIYNGKNAAVWENKGIYGGAASSSGGKEYEDASRMVTGYMPVKWETQNKFTNTEADDWLNSINAGLKTRYAYDGELNRLGFIYNSNNQVTSHGGTIPEAGKAKYVRYCFGTSGSPLPSYTEAEIEGYKRFVAVQPLVERPMASIVNNAVKVVTSFPSTNKNSARLCYERMAKYFNGSAYSNDSYREFERAHHSYAYITMPEIGLSRDTGDSDDIPVVEYEIELQNGEYRIKTRTYNEENEVWLEWTDWRVLPMGVQKKLKSLTFCDGENFVYIPNGQTVRLYKCDFPPFKEAPGTGGLYVAFGDSIVHGYTADESPRLTAFTYVDAIGKVVGLETVANMAVGGTGQFERGSHGEGCAYELLTANEDLIQQATLITLAWGKNDKNYSLGTASDTAATDTICGRWKKCLDYIRSVNPAAQIIIISSIKYADTDWDEALGTGGWSLDDLAEQVGAVAEQYNVPYITWRKCGVLNDLTEHASDNTHPDSFTYKRMGAYIAAQVGQWFKNVWDL